MKMGNRKISLIWGTILLVFVAKTVLGEEPVKGAGDKDGEMMKVPMARLTASVKNDVFDLQINIQQPVEEDGKLGDAWIKFMFEKMGEVNIRNVSIVDKVILDGSCPDGIREVRQLANLTKFLPMERTEDFDEVGSEDWMPLEDFMMKDSIGRMLIVELDDTTLCTPIRVEDDEGISTIYIRFAPYVTYNSEKLIEFLSIKSGLPKYAIQDIPVTANGSAMMQDGCSVVKIAFVSSFEDGEQLRKLYWILKNQYDLGMYSPSEMCMTDMDSSFISRIIVKNFLYDKMKNETSTFCEYKSTCPEAWKMEMTAYRERVQNYDKVMWAYKTKYGDALELKQCGQEQVGFAEGSKRSERWDEKGYSSEGKPATSDAMMNAWEEAFKSLSKYIGYNQNRVMIEKEEEFKDLILVERSMTTEERAKLLLLEEELRNLKSEDDNTRDQLMYGLCMVASKGEQSWEVLEQVKRRMTEAEDWGQEGENVLREMITKSIRMKVNEGSYNETLSRALLSSTSDVAAKTMRKKLQTIFKVKNQCSTDQERGQVLKRVKGLVGYLPSIMENCVAGISSSTLREKLNKIKESLTPEDIDLKAQKILLFMLLPLEYSNYEEMMQMAQQKFADISQEEIQMMLGYFVEWLDGGDINLLMISDIMLSSEKEMQMGCPLTQLAKMLPMPKKELAEETGGAGCSGKNREQRYPARGAPQQFYGFGDQLNSGEMLQVRDRFEQQMPYQDNYENQWNRQERQSGGWNDIEYEERKQGNRDQGLGWQNIGQGRRSRGFGRGGFEGFGV